MICQTGKRGNPPKMQMGLEEIQLGLHREFHLSVSIGVSAVRGGWRLCPRASHGRWKRWNNGSWTAQCTCILRKASLPYVPGGIPCGWSAACRTGSSAGDGERARLLSEGIFDSLKNSPPEQALLYFHRLYFSTLSKGISILDSTDISPGKAGASVAGCACNAGSGRYEAGLSCAVRRTDGTDWPGHLPQQYGAGGQRGEAVYGTELCGSRHIADNAGRTGRAVALLPGSGLFQTAGVSCVDYLAKIRMEEAARKLTETNLTVQQISESIGILNTSYFYTLFKKGIRHDPAPIPDQEDMILLVKTEYRCSLGNGRGSADWENPINRKGCGQP